MLSSLSALVAHRVGGSCLGCSFPCWAFHAAKAFSEFAGTVPPRGRLGVNGSPRARMCQAAIRILRATAALAGPVPWRAATSAYRRCHGLEVRQADWAASTAAQ